MLSSLTEEEKLDRAGLQGLQRRKLMEGIALLLQSNEFYKRKFARIDFNAARDPLTILPMTTRSEIQQDQSAAPPFGTLLTYPRARYKRHHQTSGSMGTPIRLMDTRESWQWWLGCWRIIYKAAGVTPDDRLFFPFSFGPFIGFWGAFDEAVNLGAFVLPAGGMGTSARVRYLLDNDVTFVCCTPTYALHLAEVARAEGFGLAGSTVRGLIVAGEPGGSIPATRSRIESEWGARVFDHPGMTEIGPWGFECLASPGGVHVIDSEFIAEVIEPGGEATVPEGEPGELVLTNLGRWGMPLLRYRTGDQVRVTRERCACGRSFTRAEGGVLGRLDDMLFIRGNNVFPSVIEGIVRESPEIVEFRIVVDERAALADLCIDVEVIDGADGEAVAARLSRAIQDRLHFRSRVTAVGSGTLPRFEMKAKRLVRRRDD